MNLTHEFHVIRFICVVFNTSEAISIVKHLRKHGNPYMFQCTCAHGYTPIHELLIVDKGVKRVKHLNVHLAYLRSLFVFHLNPSTKL